jgi:transposase
MKPYSLDLRHKILDAYDHKLGSQRTVAALFGVSRAFLEQLLRRRRTTGEIAPRPHAGGRQPRCDSTALALVRQLIREQPDATLEELCAQLRHRRGLCLSVATMCRVLQRLGLPRKKSPFMPPNATRRG